MVTTHLGLQRRHRWLVAMGVISLVTALAWTGMRRPSILVLHSQSERIPWTRGIDTGIDRVISPNGGVRLQRIYLHGHNAARVSTQMAEVHGFIARWRPDVILAVDDLAQAQVGTTYLAQGAPQIVYSGIEDREGTLSHSALPRVRGIAERTPWHIVERTLLQLAERRHGHPSAAEPPRPWRIALISDTGPAAEEEARGFAAHAWQAAQPVGAWRCSTLAQWQQALDAIAQQADVVVVGDYRNLAGPANWTRVAWRKQLANTALERLSLPMTALSAYAVSDGIPMGILPSPIEQGEVAAQMALDASRAASVPTVPHPQHTLTQDFALILNAQQMQQRHLDIGALEAYYARISGGLIRGNTP